METIHYYPKGTCSVEMFIDHENGIIQKVKIVRGCPGNTQGLAALLVGMHIRDLTAFNVVMEPLVRIN